MAQLDMQGLRIFSNMPDYGSIRLNNAWICLNYDNIIFVTNVIMLYPLCYYFIFFYHDSKDKNNESYTTWFLKNYLISDVILIFVDVRKSSYLVCKVLISHLIW